MPFLFLYAELPRKATENNRRLKAILHYALGLRFGKVYDQNASKTQLTRVFAQCIVYYRNIFSCWAHVLDFSRVCLAFFLRFHSRI